MLYSLLLITTAAVFGSLTAPIANIHASNSADQSISQSQSNRQSSQVVSGGYSFSSGNNINVQSQSNSGSNVIAQSLR